VKAASKYYSSGCAVQGALTIKGTRKGSKEAARAAFAATHSGQNASGIVILDEDMNYQPLSSNANESQMLEARQFNVNEIARFFNISPTLLGDLSKTSYNTLEASQQAFVLHALMPYVIMLEQELNEKLLTIQQKSHYYIDLSEEDIIKSDKQSQVNYLTTLVNAGVITRNEARTQLGFAPMEGADDLTVSFTDINQNKVNQNNEEKNTQTDEDEQE
jgi:HK97 family phage portal protein